VFGFWCLGFAPIQAEQKMNFFSLMSCNQSDVINLRLRYVSHKMEPIWSLDQIFFSLMSCNQSDVINLRLRYVSHKMEPRWNRSGIWTKFFSEGDPLSGPRGDNRVWLGLVNGSQSKVTPKKISEGDPLSGPRGDNRV
jgi:hypothetical protein